MKMNPSRSTRLMHGRRGVSIKQPEWQFVNLWTSELAVFNIIKFMTS
jgi:hypothetical protein